ncbi:protein abrupt-like [Rhagoletis pomonella]|uniref:protein abrupt-like n=1 Tax=Rhagoletis pomonella TaxID=28610 RepID=UPI00178388FD|nr:protein abrupt-like [Rhagoletis pomonella]
MPKPTPTKVMRSPPATRASGSATVSPSDTGESSTEYLTRMYEKRLAAMMAEFKKQMHAMQNLFVINNQQLQTSASLQWDDVDIIRNLKNRSTPPPQKRIKSADLFRAQHGINSERDFPVIGQHSLSRDQKIISSDCEQIAAINESNIESLVERRQTLQNQRTGTESMDDGSLEHKSNISDEDTLEHIDGQQVNNDSLHHPRSTIHNAFLGVPKGAEHQSIINLGDFETKPPYHKVYMYKVAHCVGPLFFSGKI